MAVVNSGGSLKDIILARLTEKLNCFINSSSGSLARLARDATDRITVGSISAILRVKVLRTEVQEAAIRSTISGR